MTWGFSTFGLGKIRSHHDSSGVHSLQFGLSYVFAVGCTCGVLLQKVMPEGEYEFGKEKKFLCLMSWRFLGY